MSFLRNIWYFAAWANELNYGVRLARTIIGEPILFWRGETDIHALADRCPHRLVPLSMGHIEGDTIRCAYHGLEFDGTTGRCAHNPHGPISSALSVRHYSCVERHHILWIWTGDPAQADETTIPDMSFIERAGPNAISKGYMLARANHQLFEDNILDLSHADYLHASTLGGGSMTRSVAHVEERGETIFVRWSASGEPTIPIWRSEMPDPEGPADSFFEVLWHPNGVMPLRAGAKPTGGALDDGIETWNAHIMTPETATTTHYFFVNTRNYQTDDAGYNAALAAGLRNAFEQEDKPIIEAQQQRIGDADLLDLKPALLSIDNGSTRARRIFRKLLAAEAAEAQ